MKNLKKTAAVLTSAAMMSMSMGMIAYAANPITTVGGSESTPVKGTYQTGSSSEKKYRVDISWGSMEFTYTTGAEGTWNPNDHRYDQSEPGGWSGESTIVITNHSNAALKANVTFAKADNIGGTINGLFSRSDDTKAQNSISLSLADASKEALGNFDGAPSASTTLTMDGTPDSFGEDVTIGTVTVTITNADTQ